MSRCVLDNDVLGTEVVIGWDQMMQTFFARVWDRQLYVTEKAAGMAESEAGIRLQSGGFDRIWATPDTLIALVQPYACQHDKNRLRLELLSDQANDDGERSYNFYEDEPPEPDLPAGWQPLVVR